MQNICIHLGGSTYAFTLVVSRSCIGSHAVIPPMGHSIKVMGLGGTGLIMARPSGLAWHRLDDGVGEDRAGPGHVDESERVCTDHNGMRSPPAPCRAQDTATGRR